MNVRYCCEVDGDCCCSCWSLLLELTEKRRENASVESWFIIADVICHKCWNRGDVDSVKGNRRHRCRASSYCPNCRRIKNSSSFIVHMNETKFVHDITIRTTWLYIKISNSLLHNWFHMESWHLPIFSAAHFLFQEYRRMIFLPVCIFPNDLLVFRYSFLIRWWNDRLGFFCFLLATWLLDYLAFGCPKQSSQDAFRWKYPTDIFPYILWVDCILRFLLPSYWFHRSLKPFLEHHLRMQWSNEVFDIDTCISDLVTLAFRTNWVHLS